MLFNVLYTFEDDQYCDWDILYFNKTYQQAIELIKEEMSFDKLAFGRKVRFVYMILPTLGMEV